MKYNEWRDELKNNLLSVSESERKRVLDYYAEAYADRREAGFSENKIIEGFGAPYDAAQKILHENADDEAVKEDKIQPQTPAAEEIKNSEKPASQPKRKKKSGGWIFVLLCIICCVPLFGLLMTLVGVTVGLCTAPFAAVCSGAAEIGSSIWLMATGEVAYGAYTLGLGLISLGVGIFLFPLLFKAVKLMWKLFKKGMSAIKSLFVNKEQTV